MTSRRTVLGMATTGGIALLAGCLEDILEDDIDAEADPAGVAASALESTGYEHVKTEHFEIDESFEIGDESIDLYAKSWVAGYAPADLDTDEIEDEEDLGDVDIEDAVGLAVISTPSEEFAGQEVNPAGRLEAADLVGQFSDELVDGSLESLERGEDYQVEILGESTELTAFEADLNLDEVDGEVPIYLYITSVASDDDYILPAGFHHRSLDARDDLIELIEAIEHPVDEPE